RRHTRSKRDWSSDVCSSDLFQKEKQKKEFNSENAYKKVDLSGLTPLDDALVALLSDFPAFYPGKANFKNWYGTTLNRVSKAANRSEERRVGKESRSRRSKKY